LYSPKGAKPPAFIDNFGFGIIFFGLISFTVPNRYNDHAFGELKENKLVLDSDTIFQYLDTSNSD
jgi:hypothetical protein